MRAARRAGDCATADESFLLADFDFMVGDSR